MAAEWETFESYVESLYRSLGYDTFQNHSVSGKQIDIVAQRNQPGVGLVKLLIECKHTSKESISNQEIYDFAAMYRSVKDRCGYDFGVMVTNGKYSKDARRAAEEAGVHLKQVKQLEDQYLNFSETMYAFINQYESENIFKEYIPLRGKGYFPTENESSSKSYEIIEQSIVSWIASGEGGFLTILADFGAGKTTLVNRIKYLICKATFSGEHDVYPIVFYMREYSKFQTIEEFIDYTIIREFKKRIPLHVFQRLLREKRVAVLFDGFDEISSKFGIDYRKRAFHSLIPIVSTGCASVLTCRPSFFVSKKEYEEYIDSLKNKEQLMAIRHLSESDVDVKNQKAYENIERQLREKFIDKGIGSVYGETKSGLVDLLSLDDFQINMVLEKYNDKFVDALGKDWVYVASYLREIYDIKDLLKRPLLLSMLIETLLTGYLDVSDRKNKIGISSLYEIYTSFKLDLESDEKNKGRNLLSKAQRIVFSEFLALRMHEDNYNPVFYSDIQETIRVNIGNIQGFDDLLLRHTEDEIADDLRVCTFITRNSDDSFQFIHKSFMEFFLARHIRTVMETQEAFRLLASQLPTAVLYFLGSFFGQEEKLRADAQKWYNETSLEDSSRCYLHSNIMGAALSCGSPIRSICFRSGKIHSISSMSCVLLNTRFIDVEFLNSELGDICLNSSVFENVQFVNTTIQLLSAEDCLIRVSLDDVVMRMLQTKRSELFIRSNESRIVYFVTESETSISLEGKLSLVGGVHVGTIFNMLSDAHLHAMSNRFDRCVFKPVWGSAYVSFQIEKCVFISCKFDFVLVRSKEIFERNEDNWAIKDSIFKDCEGFIIFDDSSEDESPQIAVNGKLIVVRRSKLKIGSEAFAAVAAMIPKLYLNEDSQEKIKLLESVANAITKIDSRLRLS